MQHLAHLSQELCQHKKTPAGERGGIPAGVREETEAPPQSIHKTAVDTIGAEGLLFVGKRWQSLAIFATPTKRQFQHLPDVCGTSVPQWDNGIV